jgi:release factor glutamine methyltransferase
MSLIYAPKEDSYLMKEVIEKKFSKLLDKRRLKVLEVGIGSGILLETLQKNGVLKQNIFGVDINPEAVIFCQQKGFNCFASNLFSNVKEKFDLIIFNPPYLPEDEREDLESKLATTGGKKGSEIINKFLKDAKKYLKERGRIFLLVSSLTYKIDWLNYKKKLIGEKKLFFEKLEVWELRK